MAYSRSPVFDAVRTPAKVFPPIIPNDGVFLAHVNLFGLDPDTPSIPTPVFFDGNPADEVFFDGDPGNVVTFTT
ncbi:hypothetical protein [Tropicimonas sp. S265A]|uniref:hypothetical protein n=1 Tax=Tropicimonas sp. S265A TaxID=3415134 RepID=UPI003C7BEBCA